MMMTGKQIMDTQDLKKIADPWAVKYIKVFCFIAMIGMNQKLLFLMLNLNYGYIMIYLMVLIVMNVANRSSQPKR